MLQHLIHTCIHKAATRINTTDIRRLHHFLVRRVRPPTTPTLQAIRIQLTSTRTQHRQHSIRTIPIQAILTRTVSQPITRMHM
jgi:hypothetical protein